MQNSPEHEGDLPAQSGQNRGEELEVLAEPVLSYKMEGMREKDDEMKQVEITWRVVNMTNNDEEPMVEFQIESPEGEEFLIPLPLTAFHLMNTGLHMEMDTKNRLPTYISHYVSNPESHFGKMMNQYRMLTNSQPAKRRR